MSSTKDVRNPVLVLSSGEGAHLTESNSGLDADDRGAGRRGTGGLTAPALAAVFVLGALAALSVEWAAVGIWGVWNKNNDNRHDSETETTSSSSDDHLTDAIAFQSGRACDALCELSASEIRRIATGFAERANVKTSRDASAPLAPWIAGPSGVELWQPPKAQVLAYVDGDGDKPKRYARVTVADPGSASVSEFKVGPLDDDDATNASEWIIEETVSGIPFSKRPTEPGADTAMAMPALDRTLQDIGQDALIPLFGPIFPSAFPDAYDPTRGAASPGMQNDALSPPGERYNVFAYSWVPPRALTKLESFWLHPVPLAVRINATAVDPSDWRAISVSLCGRAFDTALDARRAALQATTKNETLLCSFRNETGDLPWEVPDRTNAESPSRPRKIASDRRVTWGDWDLTVAGSRTSQGGPALFDVKFRNERVLYELSLQDAMAAYAGTENTEFFYSDASWTLSMLSTSLLPGVDCPDDAYYLPAATFYDLAAGGDAEADPSAATTFYPLCVFAFAEDHAIWRHMQNSAPPVVRGRTRYTLNVRCVCTVGNYDYVTTFAFREDGEIEVSTVFAGYIESRHVDPTAASDYSRARDHTARKEEEEEERQFSTILREDLAGPLHSHIVSIKADFDIAGETANALVVTRSTVVTDDDLDDDDETSAVYSASSAHKALSRRVVEKEGVDASTFVADPHNPGVWTVVDRAATASAENPNPRGYAITLASFATVQTLPDDHPFTRAMPYSKYHLACTQYKDAEYRSTTPYVQYDANSAYVDHRNVDSYLADEETLLDVDLVAWIGLGREHIVRQEDLPLVSNFGVHLSLQPWNFLPFNVAASTNSSTPTTTGA